MQSIIEAIPVPVFVKDEAGIYVACNKQFGEFVGKNPDEIIGKGVFELWDRNLAQTYFDADRDLMNSGGSQQYIAQVKGAAGETRNVQFHKSVFHSEDLNFRGILGIIFDITERIESENALRNAQIEAENANKLKSQFLSVMGHDIRTPLSAILGFSELIRDSVFGREMNKDYTDCAINIYNSGSFILNLINNILDMSRIEAKKYELKFEECDVGEIIEESFRQSGVMASQSKVDLLKSVETEAFKFSLDRRVCIQIFNNLISNAIKFSAAGSAMSVSASLTAEHALTVRVSDTGIGMSEDGLAKAFEPFSQVDDDSRRVYQGTGLGVPLCVDFMKMMGGSLSIDSAPGEGTTVTLVFPSHRTIPPSTKKD